MHFEHGILSIIILLVCSIGVVLGLFFAIFLLATHKEQAKAQVFLSLYLLAFSLRIGKSIVFNYYHIDFVVRNLFLGLLLLIGPSLFLYTKYLIKPSSKIEFSKGLIHYTPALLFMSLCFFIPNRGDTLSLLIYISLNLHIALYAIYCWHYTQKASDHIAAPTAKWLKLLSLATAIAAIFFVATILFHIPYVSLALLYSMLILTLSFWALKNYPLFKKEIHKYPNSPLREHHSENYMQQLTQLMQEEKLYLDPELTLAKLSDKLGINRKELSQVINQSTKNNYSRYIAGWRVEEVKRALALPENEKYKIATIAYDCGFNSLSSFNAVFKQFTGFTPVEYRQSVDKTVPKS